MLTFLPAPKVSLIFEDGDLNCGTSSTWLIFFSPAVIFMLTTRGNIKMSKFDFKDYYPHMHNIQRILLF